MFYKFKRILISITIVLLITITLSNIIWGNNIRLTIAGTFCCVVTIKIGLALIHEYKSKEEGEK